jgi:hypothetical protein
VLRWPRNHPADENRQMPASGGPAEPFPISIGLREVLNAVLDKGESIRAVVPGVDRSAIICTDRRVLVAKRGELVSDHERRPQSWRYDEVREVRIETGRIAGTVALETAEHSVRPPVLMFDERDSDEVRQAVDRLREVLGHATEAEPAPELTGALEAAVGGEPEAAAEGSAS